jgi:hypothetical protein
VGAAGVAAAAGVGRVLQPSVKPAPGAQQTSSLWKTPQPGARSSSTAAQQCMLVFDVAAAAAAQHNTASFTWCHQCAFKCSGRSKHGRRLTSVAQCHIVGLAAAAVGVLRLCHEPAGHHRLIGAAALLAKCTAWCAAGLTGWEGLHTRLCSRVKTISSSSRSIHEVHWVSAAVCGRTVHAPPKPQQAAA